MLCCCGPPSPRQIFGATDEDVDKLRIVSLYTFDLDKMESMVTGAEAQQGPADPAAGGSQQQPSSSSSGSDTSSGSSDTSSTTNKEGDK